MRKLAHSSTLVISLLAAGCVPANDREPLPFEGVDISGLDSLTAHPDWSGIETVGMEGEGYPSVPLLPLTEELRMALDSFTEESRSEFTTAGFSLEGGLFLGMRNSDIYLLSLEGTTLRRIKAPRFMDLVGTVFIPSPRYAPFLARDTLVAGYNPFVYDLVSGKADAFYAESLTLRRMIDNGGLFVGFRRRSEGVGSILQLDRIYWIPASPGGRSQLITEVPRLNVSCDLGTRCYTSFRPPWGAFAFDAHGRVYSHSGLPYQIDVYDHTGAPKRRIVRPHTPTATADVLHLFVQQMNAEEVIARISRSGGLPGNIGGLGTLLVSHEGTILVNRPDLMDDETIAEAISPFWDLFSPEGEFRGTIEIPDSVWPLAISDRALLAHNRSSGTDRQLLLLSWEP